MDDQPTQPNPSCTQTSQPGQSNTHWSSLSSNSYTPERSLDVRKVTNGFIVETYGVSGKKYIAHNKKSLVDLLTDLLEITPDQNV